VNADPQYIVRLVDPDVSVNMTERFFWVGEPILITENTNPCRLKEQRFSGMSRPTFDLDK
jgi:hypothetical protein